MPLLTPKVHYGVPDTWTRDFSERFTEGHFLRIHIIK